MAAAAAAQVFILLLVVDLAAGVAQAGQETQMARTAALVLVVHQMVKAVAAVALPKTAT
jgi:hypothetical protein